MLVQISRYHKVIAGFFVLLFEAELVMVPAQAKAGPMLNLFPSPFNEKGGKWKDYLKKEGASFFNGLKEAGNSKKENGPRFFQKPFIPFQKAKTNSKDIGPGQPEMQSFSSVNANNMVDLFSGDFSYNIPLMDVGGYPVNLAYRGGISMDQEASWVGLGWNINPGTITRNLRGLPDDFDGADSIKKITSIKPNKTIGVTGGADLEITGFPIGGGTSLGVFHNNYKGWGLENSINASINAEVGAKGPLSGGLSLTSNTQEGLTIAPSILLKLGQAANDEITGAYGTFSTSLAYNSRTGLKGLQLSAGIRQNYIDEKNQKYSSGGEVPSTITFALPSFNPTITMPFSSSQYSFTAKVGGVVDVFHPSFYINGYISKTQIAPADTLLTLPAYGYLYSQDGAKNKSALLDFNREKELPYREKPAIPHIAVPYYTYDAFSITGEGTGGMFRAYRGDIGFVHDHFIRSKDASGRASVDIGLGDIVHAGIDLNVSRAFTQNDAWLDQNTMRSVVNFTSNNGLAEAAYFRNPGEKSVNSKQFYHTLGDDDVVTVGLYQPGPGSSTIQATNYLMQYHNKQLVGFDTLNARNAVKPQRDKRTQVISYLTAKEASYVGISKYIENHLVNQFSLNSCITGVQDIIASKAGTGLFGEYFNNMNWSGTPFFTVVDSSLKFGNKKPFHSEIPPYMHPQDHFSVRWTGRVKAPVTGQYIFTTSSDDGVRLWLNDSILINHSNDHPKLFDNDTVNLFAGEYYKIRIEYYQNQGDVDMELYWNYGGVGRKIIPTSSLYPPPTADTVLVNSNLSLENRVNSFRKPNHISEIDVLNGDGRRYVYGIPVYNFKQKEATFAVNYAGGNTQTGLVKYSHDVTNADNTAGGNQNGKDHYFSSEETPAYAHSFLLTGILSPDYVDLTGDGISNDDLGDAVKFNYSKICGKANPFKWRAPYVKDSATYNEGLKTDNRDDKGNYVYGEKELWYMHSIESKTMIATFLLQNRNDLLAIDEGGNKYVDSSAKCLKQIDLYSKADFLKHGSNAVPIKTVHFEYSYELCLAVNRPVLQDSGKLTLKRIWFTYNGNDKGKLNPYIFHYSPKNPSYNIKSYDRWGNYKDPLQNPGSSTGHLITNSEYPYALQDSTMAAQNSAAWSLDSVFLPSGGSIKVDFEGDDYAYVQNKRAMQLFKLLGLGAAPGLSNPSNQLYTGSADNLYVYVSVPQAVSSTADVFQKYLTGVQKLFFKLFVRMPDDAYGSGSDYVSCYADLDQVNAYGMVSSNVIWIKISGISLSGVGGGSYSPLAKAAIQFLRLNLPSKAYPGSEVGDNIDLADAVKMIFSLADNIKNAFSSFDATARGNNWAYQIDTSKSFIRLNSPNYRKFGGGHRVKRITIYDNWNAMTKVASLRTATYGQEYTYTTQKQINGVLTTISSGVASYEPGIGGEENPFHQPIEYVEKISALGPVNLGYSEEPLGESLFPAAGIGYSKVRVRTINYKNKKSANGFDETMFYTAYDFPTYTDRTVLDNDTKKRYKPSLSNFLRVNAKYYLGLSQGFKVELNDMHGKLRSQASYPETDPNNPVTYTENIYKVANPASDQKILSNTVMAMSPDGTIDTTALIGKDAEIMMDMREQISVSNGANVSLNTDVFAMPFIPPLFIIPSFIGLAQRQQDQFRSVATVKVIQRYGIVDSVIHIDKGSKVSTKDLLYDSETGDVLLTRTQNEFNDPVYTFHYPTHWAYDGAGPAYKNIALMLSHISIKNGKITGGSAVPDSTLFSSGDELFVSGKLHTVSPIHGCLDSPSTFPEYAKIWAVDSSVLHGGAKAIYFVDKFGTPYNGKDISMKVTRSGRRNISGIIGSVTTLVNPLVKDTSSHLYSLVLNTSSKVVQASASLFNQFWQVANVKVQRTAIQIICPDSSKQCFDTIAANHQDTTMITCFSPTKDTSYSSAGAFIYPSIGDTTSKEAITDTTGFWRNLEIGPSDLTDGRLNRVGIWACNGCPMGFCKPPQTWIGFSIPVFIPKTDTVFIGLAGDNQVRVIIDTSTTIQLLQSNSGDKRPFSKWYIFPIKLTKGYHYFKIQGWNVDSISAASFGAEVYNLTRGQLLTADSNFIKVNTLFSTRDVASNQDSFAIGNSCPLGYFLDSTSGKCLKYISCPGICDTIYSTSCYNAFTDTSFNPFTTGVLGNWRANKNYSYFGPRAETDPLASTNTRKNGTFNDFIPYWAFQSGSLKSSTDTTRWVWNSQMTLFNQKGFEIENKDPLGRYNSGIYGYNQTLPIAVIQNGRFRESAFEGFEDYGFLTGGCDTSCPATKHFDFTAFAGQITTTQKHTGKSSLQVNAGGQASLSFTVVKQDTAQANLSFNTQADTCSGIGTTLKNIKIPNTILLPPFGPFNGKQMVLSAWVKEAQDCSCKSYTNDSIYVSFVGSAPQTLRFGPSGQIIEGWQRYESFFTIPANDTTITISLRAPGAFAAYFDDIRIEPFNANMKSFVYNPVNLRLMAELDENNYATFYEYDDDGTLIRVKKETEKGIMTIKETRSALIKQ
jgi:hypothetical protein